jgi:hypothetical protein
MAVKTVKLEQSWSQLAGSLASLNFVKSIAFWPDGDEGISCLEFCLL